MTTQFTTPCSPDQDSGYSGSPTGLPPSAATRSCSISTDDDALSDHASNASSIQVEVDRLIFWERQRLTQDKSRRFLTAAEFVFLYGPDPNTPGLRFDADQASKDDIPDVLLRAQPEQGPPDVRTPLDLTMRAASLGGDPSWDVLDAARYSFETYWPAGIPEGEPYRSTTGDLKGLDITSQMSDDERARAVDWVENVEPFKRSIHLHPGHFTGDWGFFEGALVDLREYSLTFRNYPLVEFERLLQPERTSYPRVQRHFSKPREERYRSSLGRAELYGRSWTIHSVGPVMPWNVMVFASSQVILGHDVEDDRILQVGVMLPKRYAASWPSTVWTNWCCVGTSMLHVQFHVRYLRLASTIPKLGQAKQHYTGMRLERYRPRILSKPQFALDETRISIGVLTSMWQTKPHFTMSILADTGDFSIDCLHDQFRWASMGLNLDDEGFSGVAIFQFAVRRLITEWERWWTHTLNQIRTTTIESFPSRPRCGLMLEERLREKELLHQARHMIEELKADLQGLDHDVSHSLACIQSPSSTLKANWESLHAYHKKAETKLLALVDKILATPTYSDIASISNYGVMWPERRMSC